MSTTVQVKNSTKHIQLICVTGLFAAMIYVLTAWLHIPTGAGYTHAGDGLIYLAASMLPTPYAMAAGAIGAGGLGATALTYGYQNFNEKIMYSIVVILIILVAVIQFLGDWLYKKLK